MSGINMNSLRKKQKQFENKGSVAPSESKIKEEPKEDNPPVPEWKKNLLRNRNGTKSMNKGSSGQYDSYFYFAYLYVCVCPKYVTKSGEFQKNIPGGLTRGSSFNTQKGKIGDTLFWNSI